MMKTEEMFDRVAKAFIKPPESFFLTERVTPEGELVMRFVFPLKLLPLPNAGRRQQPWSRAQHRKAVLQWMSLLQKKYHPLEGHTFPLKRPLVVAIRFSSVPPDEHKSVDGLGFKTALDCLVPARLERNGRTRSGLGYITDDRPTVLQRIAWWESCSPNNGMGLLEIWERP